MSFLITQRALRVPFLIAQRALRVPFLIAQRVLKVPFFYKVTVPFFVPGVNTNDMTLQNQQNEYVQSKD